MIAGKPPVLTSRGALSRSYPRVVERDLQLLATRIYIGRVKRGWSIAELAERVGCAPNTIRKIEGANPAVAWGTVLDAAGLVDARIFHESPGETTSELRENLRVIGILPKRVHQTSRRLQRWRMRDEALPLPRPVKTRATAVMGGDEEELAGSQPVVRFRGRPLWRTHPEPEHGSP